MKILLIAYEFPPILAAQALRWFYLANELADIGVDIHVVCPDISPENTFPMEMDSRITIHRVWPGPFIGFSQKLVKKFQGKNEVSNELNTLRPSRLFHVYRVIRIILDVIFYPDVRSEWYPFAFGKIKRLLKRERFDVVISSHEPAVDIFVGHYARKLDIPWVIDMGDPLLTPYSPKWRRGIDLRVERKIIQSATSIWVTADSVLDLLKNRHGASVEKKISVLPQGFSHRPVGQWSKENERRFCLVFTGNFYRDFRSPIELAKALFGLKDLDVSLVVAGNNSEFEPMFRGVAGVKFVGQKGHFECLSLQRQADVLVNIGNVQSYQIPGKIYEYLGAQKAILHIKTASDFDPSVELLKETGSGVVVQNNSRDIELALRGLHEKWKNDPHQLTDGRNEDVIQAHSWSYRARECKELLKAVSHQP